jgi:hypothetical protein
MAKRRTKKVVCGIEKNDTIEVCDDMKFFKRNLKFFWGAAILLVPSFIAFLIYIVTQNISMIREIAIISTKLSLGGF